MYYKIVCSSSDSFISALYLKVHKFLKKPDSHQSLILKYNNNNEENDELYFTKENRRT